MKYKKDFLGGSLIRSTIHPLQFNTIDELMNFCKYKEMGLKVADNIMHMAMEYKTAEALIHRLKHELRNKPVIIEQSYIPMFVEEDEEILSGVRISLDIDSLADATDAATSIPELCLAANREAKWRDRFGMKVEIDLDVDFTEWPIWVNVGGINRRDGLHGIQRAGGDRYLSIVEEERHKWSVVEFARCQECGKVWRSDFFGNAAHRARRCCLDHERAHQTFLYSCISTPVIMALDCRVISDQTKDIKLYRKFDDCHHLSTMLPNVDIKGFYDFEDAGDPSADYVFLWADYPHKSKERELKPLIKEAFSHARVALMVKLFNHKRASVINCLQQAQASVIDAGGGVFFIYRDSRAIPAELALVGVDQSIVATYPLTRYPLNHNEKMLALDLLRQGDTDTKAVGEKLLTNRQLKPTL